MTFGRTLAVALLLGAAACERSDEGARLSAEPSPAARGEPTKPAREVDASPKRAGAVTGRVRYVGPPPGETTMFVPEAAKNLEAHTTIVDAGTGGLKNAVVWIEGVPVAPDAAAAGEVVVDQRDFTFLPHVLAVRAGQQVRFTNSDGANHNAHSFARGNEFNLGVPVGTGVTRAFRRPTGREPVRVECDVHSWMRAWIYVFGHPYFAVTDRTGTFRIEEVPPGQWTLVAHHADGALAAERELAVDGDARVEIELIAPEDRGDGSAGSEDSTLLPR